MIHTFCHYNQHNEVIENGTLQIIPKGCMDVGGLEQCRKKLQTIYKSEDGLYYCNYGYSIYKNGETILCCLKVVGRNTNRTKKNKGSERRIAFNVSELEDYLSRTNDEYKEVDKYYKYSMFLEALVHDYRKYNEMNVELCEKLNNRITEARGSVRSNDIAPFILSLNALINIGRARIDTYNYIINDNLDFDMEPVQINLHRLFDKLRRCENNINRKNIRIVLNSTDSIPDVRLYRDFETACYLIIDNAMKYSDVNKQISITIVVKHNCLVVKVTSIGPRCQEDEVDKIFDRGVRGVNARKVEKDGQGLGLYTVKNICMRNRIQVSAESTGDSYQAKGVDYCTFGINMIIPRLM